MKNDDATEMELRVATALWNHEGGESTPHDSGRCIVADYIEMARAAIRAIQESAITETGSD